MLDYDARYADTPPATCLLYFDDYADTPRLLSSLYAQYYAFAYFIDYFADIAPLPRQPLFAAFAAPDAGSDMPC